MLSIAAVEGDEFIAQVVAQVRGVDEREVARRLSRELDRQHQLVAERGIERVGRQRLYLFAFRHILFQTHLYNTLGGIDRSLLHEDVGSALEALYADHATNIAVELSFHFLEAGLEERALPYLIEAGDQARRTFANQEAVGHYSQALSIIDETLARAPAGEIADWQQMQFDVLGRREEVYDRLGKRTEQAADLEQMLALAEQLGERQQAEVYNRQSRYAWATGDYDESTATALKALPLMQTVGDKSGEGEARSNLGQAARETGDYQTAFREFRAAAELFEAAGAIPRQAGSLTRIGTLHSELGQFEEALQYFHQALDISRGIDNEYEQAYALDQIGIIHAIKGDYSQALQHSRKALALAQAIGDKLLERSNLVNVGVISAYLGDYERAIDLVHEALTISRVTRDQSGETVALVNLGDFHRALGRYDEALAHLETALNLARQLKRSSWVAVCHYALAVTYHQRRQAGDLDHAMEHAREAITTAEQAGVNHIQVLSYSCLAMAYLLQGELDKAVNASTRAVEQLEEIGPIEGSEEEVYFNHFQVLQAAGLSVDAAAALQQAQQMVRAKAERISKVDQSIAIHVGRIDTTHHPIPGRVERHHMFHEADGFRVAIVLPPVNVFGAPLQARRPACPGRHHRQDPPRVRNQLWVPG